MISSNLPRAPVAFKWKVAGALLLLAAATPPAYFAIAWYLRIPAAISHNVIRVGAIDRDYRLVIPDCSRGQKNLPVVFALHGAVHTTDAFAEETGLDRLAAKHGFLLVYLQGRLGSWPATITPKKPESLEPDLDFFDAMCDLMVARYAADRSRFYLVGSSQGGAMCNVFVATHGENIAAAVCHCGWMPEPLDVEPLHTSHKTPMLFLVGSLDVQVPPSAVKQARDVFAKAGHPTEFELLDGADHGWKDESRTNDKVWQYLSPKKL